ncbi:MAG: hypothetical protein ABIK62_07270, partial [candidate division WOR-3 bacterium]
GLSGKKKKVKDGAALAWHAGTVYALKGGNTLEAWAYSPSVGWQQLEDMPAGGGKRVKGGGALAVGTTSTDQIGMMFGMKGNNTLEFYGYPIPDDFRPRPPATPLSSAQGYPNDLVPGYDLKVLPNPCAGLALVTWTLRQPGHVNASLYDLGGARILELYDGVSPAGSHFLRLDGRGLPSGVYLVSIECIGATPDMTRGSRQVVKTIIE